MTEGHSPGKPEAQELLTEKVTSFFSKGKHSAASQQVLPQL